MSDEIEQKIKAAIDLPLKYELDGEKIESRSISELVQASKHLSKKRAAKNPFAALKGIRFSTEGPGR